MLKESKFFLKKENCNKDSHTITNLIPEIFVLITARVMAFCTVIAQQGKYILAYLFRKNYTFFQKSHHYQHMNVKPQYL